MKEKRLIQTKLNRWLYYNEEKKVILEERENFYINISARIIIRPGINAE